MDAQSSTQGRRVALITGVTGQDASHLAELLLAKGYVVCARTYLAYCDTWVLRRALTHSAGKH